MRLPFCGRKPHTPASVFFHEAVKAVMYLKVHIRPVVKPSPPDMLVIYIKAQGPDKMELGVSRRACPCNVARIGRYLRFYKKRCSDSF